MRYRILMFFAMSLGLTFASFACAGDGSGLSINSEKTSPTFPILAIQQVSSIADGDKREGLIVVKGVASPSCSGPTSLNPFYDPPVDLEGTLDLLFSCESTEFGSVELQSVMGRYVFSSTSEVKAVRVRGVANVLTTQIGKSVAISTIPVDFVKKMIGKSPPKLDSNGKLIDLPSEINLRIRIVKPTDPISDASFDPNRITLYLGVGSIIVGAKWN